MEPKLTGERPSHSPTFHDVNSCSDAMREQHASCKVRKSFSCRRSVADGDYRPDIEGIGATAFLLPCFRLAMNSFMNTGTRIATYSQLFLTIFTIALTPVVRSFDAWWAALVTSLGLQFAAIAQRAGLTLFHAIIITWLAFPVFAMSWPYIFLHWRCVIAFLPVLLWLMKELHARNRGDAMPPEILIATHIHGFLFVG